MSVNITPTPLATDRESKYQIVVKFPDNSSFTHDVTKGGVLTLERDGIVNYYEQKPTSIFTGAIIALAERVMALEKKMELYVK